MSHLSPGLWGVLATPFDDALGVDLASLQREVGSFASDGADGLVALGVFGEAASLNPDEQDAVARTVASTTDLPYVLGLSEREPAALVGQAERLLAAVPRPPVAVMAQVADADPERAVAGFARLYEATGVDVVVQDYPVVSGVSVTDDQLTEIVRACPFAAAVKSESPPTSVSVAHLTATVEPPVFGGLGGVGLLDELAAGSAGAMTGFSHPSALAAVLRAQREDGFAAAAAAWSPWLPLANFEGQPRIGLSLRKELLRRRGVIASGAVRPPAPPLPPALVPLLEQHLRHVPADQSATR